ncbi:MAG TPA: hypothetical protein VLY45_01840 [Nitrospiria bacterium]|nr:hypothetical protein [Nitrospiria bacterium]
MKQPGLAWFVDHSSVCRFLLLGVALFGLSLSDGRALAAEAPPPAKPPSPEVQKSEVFSANFDATWDKLLSTLKSFDLAVAQSDKEKGTIATAPHRYFKITSAKFPPVQDDYRDTYDIKIEKRTDKKTTQVQITRKFEIYDRTVPPAGGWVVQQNVPANTGTSISEIFSALGLELAAAALPAAR